MPLLSDKANMEYNPNSIFGTSQKLRTIALKNLENSAENPDIAQSKRPIDIKEFYEDFLSELVGISSQQSALKSLVSSLIDSLKLFKNSNPDELEPEERAEWLRWNDRGDVEGIIRLLANNPQFKIKDSKLGKTKQEGTLEGRGRKKIVGKYLPRFTDRFTGRPEPNSWVVANVNGQKMTGGSGKGKKGKSNAKSVSTASSLSDASSSHFSQPSRRGTRPSDMLGEFGDADSDFGLSSVGTNPSNTSSTWETIGTNSSYRGRAGGDPSDSDPSDSDGSSDSDLTESSRGTDAYSGEPAPDANNQDAEEIAEDEFDYWDEEGLDDVRNTGIKQNPLLYVITKLISLVSKANILFNARIKKNINYFDRLDVQDMAEKVEKVIEQSNNIGLDIVSLYLDNGFEIASQYRNALDKLYLDVAIAVKSYAQKAQSGGSISGGSLKKLSFQEFYKNCPTKYLL
jgi:hypothetical protein